MLLRYLETPKTAENFFFFWNFITSHLREIMFYEDNKMKKKDSIHI